MKKEDLKNAYDDITISDAQKERIYQNIMHNKKKKHSFIPWISTGLVLALGCFAFMFFSSTNPANSTNPMFKGSAELASNYKKEVIINATTYLSASKIDLTTLKESEELEIDSNKVVTDEKYQGCSGKLIIKRYKDGYTYTPKTTCGEDAEEKVVSYYIYDGYVNNITQLGDYFLIESHTNESKSLGDVDYKSLDLYDENLLLFDVNGNVVWEFLLKRQTTNGSVGLQHVEKINDTYFMVVEYLNDIRNEKIESGEYRGSSTKKMDFILLDHSGKEINNANLNILKDEFAKYNLYSFSNTFENTIVFKCYMLDGSSHFIEVNKTDFSIKQVYEDFKEYSGSGLGLYDNTIWIDNVQERTVSIYDAATKENLSSITYPKNYDLYQMEKRGQNYYLVFEEDASKEDKPEFYLDLWVFDKDFHKIHEEKLDQNESKNFFYSLNYFNFYGDKLYMNTRNFATDQYYIYSFDLNGNRISKEKVKELDESIKTQWSHLTHYSYTTEGFNMIYTAKNVTIGEEKNNTGDSNQILFATIR